VFATWSQCITDALLVTHCGRFIRASVIAPIRTALQWSSWQRMNDGIRHVNASFVVVSSTKFMQRINAFYRMPAIAKESFDLENTLIQADATWFTRC